MKSDNGAELSDVYHDKQKTLNPLARLDVAMDKFIRTAEDFMIRTSYQTDKQTGKEIALLKSKEHAMATSALDQRQKLLEIRKGYSFLASQLDDLIRDLDIMISGEQDND